jgi:hypothetical protein
MALMAFHAIKNFYDGSWEELSWNFQLSTLTPLFLSSSTYIHITIIIIKQHHQPCVGCKKEIMEIFSSPIFLVLIPSSP